MARFGRGLQKNIDIKIIAQIGIEVKEEDLAWLLVWNTKTKEQAEKKITDKINDICKNILFNTAVFKNDENGEAGFNRFMKFLEVE